MAKQQYIPTEYSDGAVVLSNVRDSKTNETYSLERVGTLPDGTLLTDELAQALSPIYRKLGSDYFARVDFLKDRTINVKSFGAIGDGVTDDSLALARAFSFPANKIFVPEGKYLNYLPLSLNESVKEVSGYGAEIIYDKEQETVNPTGSESCLSIIGLADTVIKGLSLKYTGTFNLGVTYNGVISGFRITNSHRVTLSKCSASGFNYTGCIVAGDRPYNTVAYCNDIKIINCNFSYNRVAGVYHGNTNGLQILNNILTFNGLEGDPGTGYGCAGMSSLIPINTTISNNNASRNIRKGVDFHAGKDTIIANNIMQANGLFGISYDSNGDFGKVIISGNTVSDMTIDGSLTPSPLTYGYGIYAGSYDGQLSSAIDSNIIITDNIIENCTTINNGSFSAFRLLVHGLHKASMALSNNKIDCGIITAFIEQRNSAATPGEYFDLRLMGNSFKAVEVKSNALQLVSSKCRNLEISSNDFTIISEYMISALIAITASTVIDWNKLISSNTINIVKSTPWGSYLPFTLIGNNKERVLNNYQNGVALREWTGYGFIDFGTAPPTAGMSYFKNSIRYNSDSNVNSVVGWVCVSSGNPGTWVAFGELARKSGPNAGKPTNPVQGQMYYNTSAGRPEWFNGTDWVNSDPLATVNFPGIVKQIPSLPTTVTMEQLITALKTAGLMAP